MNGCWFHLCKCWTKESLSFWCAPVAVWSRINRGYLAVGREFTPWTVIHTIFYLHLKTTFDFPFCWGKQQFMLFLASSFIYRKINNVVLRRADLVFKNNLVQHKWLWTKKCRPHTVCQHHRGVLPQRALRSSDCADSGKVVLDRSTNAITPVLFKYISCIILWKFFKVPCT